MPSLPKSYHVIFCANHESAAFQVKELRLIGTDDLQVLRRGEKLLDPVYIIEPELSRSVVRGRWQAGEANRLRVTLNVLPNCLLDFREGLEERSMIVFVILDKLLMRYILAFTKQYGELDHERAFFLRTMADDTASEHPFATVKCAFGVSRGVALSLPEPGDDLLLQTLSDTDNWYP